MFVTGQDDLEIVEEARPVLDAGGGRLRRIFTVTAPEHRSSIFHRAAVGDRITDAGEGRWRIDDEMTIVVTDASAIVRTVGDQQELLVPILLRRSGDAVGTWTGRIDLEVDW